MKLSEFINHNKHCIYCGTKNIMMMCGTIQENIYGSSVNCLFTYMIPVHRKNFFTFALGNFAVFASNEDLDLDTFHKDKYQTFSIDNDGYVKFDYNFHYKMRLNFRVMCPEQHYSYSSRNIRVSDKSPDITKGYPIASEELAFGNYRVICNPLDNETLIINGNVSNQPITVPYMNISMFPCDDEEKFVRKVENVLLLA